MKIIFFGLGSIGRRHAQIINRYYPEYKIYRYITERSCKIWDIRYIPINSWKQIEAIKPDIAFICNPTYLHIETAIQCAKRNIHLFIEKPLCSNDDYLFNLIEIVSRNNLIAYVAYPFRFNFHLFNNRNEILLLSNGCANIVCNTNIEKWGKKSYSFDPKKGGGAIFELSHEIDIVRWLYGRIHSFTINNKWNYYKKLINSSAINIYHDNGSRIKIDLNLYSDKEERYLYIMDSNGKRLRYNYKATDQMYIDQIHYFFNAVKNNNRFLMNNIYEASDTFQKILEMNRR